MLKLKSIFLSLAIVTLLATGCKKSLNNSDTTGQFDRSVAASTPDNRAVPTISKNIPNVISSNLFLDKDTLWIINGPTYVTNNATLTIEAGAFVKGKSKTETTNNYPSFLLVTRGAKLIAEGTASDPIVFTSSKTAGNRLKGDWGGIVLLGKAKTNVGEFQIEGVKGVYASSFGLDSSTVFKYSLASSPDDADNSGSLKFVRIEFAGDVISEGNELNGLTCGAVGYNTVLQNIQVSYGADDAFEFFGGAVNATNLISLGNDDDEFDTDQGYQGSVQFFVGLKIPSLGLSPTPNGMESNNITSPVVTGGPNPTRLTRPTLSNFTLLGTNTAGTPAPATGSLFRVNSGYIVRNSIIGGFTYGVNLSGGTASGSEYSYSVVHGFTAAVNGTPAPTSSTTFTSTTTNDDLLLVNPFNTTNPDFRYLDGSPAEGIANFTGLSVAFPGGSLSSFTSTSYAGAFDADGSTRWDATWSSYSPNSNPY